MTFPAPREKTASEYELFEHDGHGMSPHHSTKVFSHVTRHMFDKDQKHDVSHAARGARVSLSGVGGGKTSGRLRQTVLTSPCCAALAAMVTKMKMTMASSMMQNQLCRHASVI